MVCIETTLFSLKTLTVPEISASGNPCFENDVLLQEAPCSCHAITKVSAQVLEIANGCWLVLYCYKPEFLFLILSGKPAE